MQIELNIPHDWLYPPSLNIAADIQREMATKVSMQDDFGKINCLAGMDVSNNPYVLAQNIYACIVILNSEGNQLLETANEVQVQRFPYVPGFLGFREAPVLIQAFKRLKHRPDVIFVDGHGISHPRGLGIASHIGVLLNIPTIGVAKSLLVGKPEKALPAEPGAQVPVVWRGKTIAMLLRTKARCNPLIISTGHRVSLTTAVELVHNYLRGYRLPEPTRQAHLAANVFRRSGKNLSPPVS